MSILAGILPFTLRCPLRIHRWFQPSASRPLPRVVMMRRAIQFLISFISIIGLYGCAEPTPSVINGPVFGTTYTVKWYEGPDGSTEEAIQSGINAVLENIDSRMSTYRDDSELSRFNTSPINHWFPVSPATFQVVQAAQQVSRLSDGYFDATVGPAVDLWGFGAAGRRESRPSEEQIQHTMKLIGHGSIQLREEDTSVRKMKSVRLDLSAIAKGYAVDAVSAYLESTGIRRYMVEIGGELRLGLPKSSGDRWVIGVEMPDVNRRMVKRALALEQTGVATSGDYRNFFEVDGQRYSHTINPKTGRPVSHDLVSVTVLHPSALLADAWATAFLAMGQEAAEKLAEEQQLAALFISKHEGTFQEYVSKAFLEFLAK